MKKSMKLLALVMLLPILVMSLTGCFSFIASEQEPTSNVMYEKQIKDISETTVTGGCAIKSIPKEDTIVEKEIIVSYGVERKDPPGDKIILQWSVNEEDV